MFPEKPIPDRCTGTSKTGAVGSVVNGSRISCAHPHIAKGKTVPGKSLLSLLHSMEGTPGPQCAVANCPSDVQSPIRSLPEIYAISAALPQLPGAISSSNGRKTPLRMSVVTQQFVHGVPSVTSAQRESVLHDAESRGKPLSQFARLGIITSSGSEPSLPPKSVIWQAFSADGGAV